MLLVPGRPWSSSTDLVGHALEDVGLQVATGKAERWSGFAPTLEKTETKVILFAVVAALL